MINQLVSLGGESKRIFKVIQRQGPITKSELVLITKIKLTSLNRMVQPLEELGLVISSGIGESSGGRKPTLYDVNTNAYYLIGIDISRTYTQVIVADLKMTIVAKERFEMTNEHTPIKTVKSIVDIINTLLRRKGIAKQKVLGIGVGTIGPINREKEIILNPRHFMANDWRHTPIKAMMEKALDLPVIIDNGANTAVLAEAFYGKGRGNKNIAYVHCGIGIRTGVIASGVLVRTMNDVEDAFGHMVVDVDGEKCSCGNYGCIETYVSIAAIVKQFVKGVKKGRKTRVDKPLENISYLDICIAAEQGDLLSREMIINAGTIFGVGLVNYMNLLNPQLVVLSGPIILQSPLFFDICTQTAKEKHYMKNESQVVFSKGGIFKEEAIAVGAAAVVLKEVFEDKIKNDEVIL